MKSIHYRELLSKLGHPAFSAVLLGLGMASSAVHAATVGTNLIVNGSGQAPAGQGWNLFQNGGAGWGWDSYGGADAQPGFFTTSYLLDQRSQLIDLEADGYTAAQLDAAPLISASEAITSNLDPANPFTPDRFYIKVQLLAADMSVVAEWDVGSATALADAPNDWATFSHSFTGYGPGVRYVRFEDGGLDSRFSSGNLGAAFDAATVTVTPVPEYGAAALAGVAFSAAALRRRRR